MRTKTNVELTKLETKIMNLDPNTQMRLKWLLCIFMLVLSVVLALNAPDNIL
jgi:hypothetical protein